MTTKTSQQTQKAKSGSPRQHRRLSDHLPRQLTFLRNSARLFDDGQHDEALRLATTLRVLLHDTFSQQGKPVSVSLLTHLGLKSALRFVDTGIYRDQLTRVTDAWFATHAPGSKAIAEAPSEVGLAEMRLNPDGHTFGWYAPLREQRFPANDHRHGIELKPQPFQDWWERTLIEGTGHLRFSRKNLVLVMANQDGGAHVDELLDRAYDAFTADDLGVQMEMTNQPFDGSWDHSIEPVKNNVAYACVRQIAFEVLLTLERHLNPPMQV